MSGGQVRLTRPAAAVRAGVASLDFCPMRPPPTFQAERAPPSLPGASSAAVLAGRKAMPALSDKVH